MDFFEEVLEAEVIGSVLGNSRRRGYGYGGQSSVSAILEFEAIEDLAQGDVGGFLEDEMMASIF